MFLHLGGDVIIPKKEVIAIIDMEASNQSQINKDFLDIAINEELVNKITKKEKAKSFIITSEVIYFSPISSVTLKKRFQEVLGVEVM